MHEMPHELVVNLVLYDKSCAGHTCLTRGHEGRKGHAVGRSHRVGVIEDDNWCLATQLGSEACQICACYAA